MRNTFSITRISDILWCAFAFLLTLTPWQLPLLLAPLLVLWFIEGGLREKMRYFFSSGPNLILPLLYLLYVATMLYTANKELGAKDLETKFGLLLFPLLLPAVAMRDGGKGWERIMKWFVWGCSLSMLICLLTAVIRFSIEMYHRYYDIPMYSYPYTNYFFYSYLSLFMHYGYYAMYVNMAIAYLMYELVKNYANYTTRGRWLRMGWIALLSVFVLMLYAKAGMICLFLLYLLLAGYVVVTRKKYKAALWVFSGLAALLLLSYTVIPHTRERIQGMWQGVKGENLDPASTESTQVRVFVWKSARELIAENPLWGYGTGDARDELIENYRKNGYTGALYHHLNAHNQYLQTWLAVGLTGVLLLIVFFVAQLLAAVRQKLLLPLLFTAIAAFSFLTEAVLETQAGVFFTAFFGTLVFVQIRNYKAAQ